jgi:hypothetical protein
MASDDTPTALEADDARLIAEARALAWVELDPTLVRRLAATLAMPAEAAADAADAAADITGDEG